MQPTTTNIESGIIKSRAEAYSFDVKGSIFALAGKVLEIARLKINFPEWQLGHVAEGRRAYDSYVQIAAGLGIFTDNPETPEQITVTNALIRKKHNAMAVVGTYTQGQDRVSTEYVNALVGSELTIVDLPDDISEATPHTFDDGLSLYTTAASAVNGRDERPTITMPQPYSDLMQAIGSETRNYTARVLDKVADPNTRLAVGTEITRVIEGYGVCVETMHLSNPTDRLAISSRQDNTGRYTPEWLASSDIDYLAWGSPLEVYGLLYEAEYNPNFTVADVNRIKDLYRLVPIIHTFLDGLADYASDKKIGNRAPNITELAISGGLDEVIVQMQTGLSIQQSVPESASQKLITFAQLLARYYRQTEIDFIADQGSINPKIHRQVVRDLIKFHKIQLAKAGAKSNNLEYVTIDIFEGVVGKV